MVKPPSYITKNRLGIYSFQVRLPTAITRYNPHLKHLLRFTLETRDKAIALRLARRKIVVLDSIRLLFKDDSKSTARAVELWVEYEKSIGTRFGWAAVDEFLSELDDGDRHLLEAILSCQSGLDSQKALMDENAVLKKALSMVGTAGRATVEDGDDIALRDVRDKFLSAKLSNDSAKSSIVSYGFATSVFVEIMCALSKSADLRVSSIKAADVRRYVDLMYVWPKNHKLNAATKGMSYDQIINLLTANAKPESESSVANVESLSPRTIQQRFTIVRELLNYIEHAQYSIKPNLGSMIKFAGQGGGKSKVDRASFNDAELKLLFESDKYRLRLHKRSSDYWVSLLALFTGATQSELVQLYVNDVILESNIWALDINDKADKRLKTKDGRPRVVPLHPQLLKLGFDRFVEKCRASKQVRLFPEELRNERDQFSSYSKRFNRFRRDVKVGVEADRKVDFHSFRHLVSTRLIGAGNDEGVVNDIIGHASRMRSETRKTYSEGAFLSVKYDVICKLKYDIDFNYTKFWR
jgi:integrase